MSCRELERLFAAGASEAQASAHRAGCSACDALGRDIDSFAAIASGLERPLWSESLRESLVSIPSRTVSCEGADAFLPLAVEGELDDRDAERLRSHLSRCEACTESAAVLLCARELALPEPPPWLAARITARKPRPVSGIRRWLLNPRAAIAFAYAAAVVVLLTGFNPVNLARKAGQDLGPGARAAVASAGSSMVERIGEFQEKAIRKLAVFKGRAAGYGRAALSIAVSRFMKSEPEPRRKESGNRDGAGTFKEKESEISTWRA